MTRARARNRAEVTGPRSDILMEEPPDDGRTRYDWAAIAAKLRRKPGKWHNIFKQDRSTLVSAIRQGHISALSAEKGFEVRSANNKHNLRPRLCDLYLRYNPEADTTKETSE